MILRPSERAEGEPERWQPEWALAESVQEYGYYPDVRLWEPGDLVLIRYASENWPDPIPKNLLKILKYQEALGFPEEDATWHHAAIWCGRYLCESTPFDHLSKWRLRGAVIPAAIEKYYSRCDITVRRPSGASRAARAEIAFDALIDMGGMYDWRSLLGIQADRWKKDWLDGGDRAVVPGEWRPESRRASGLREAKIDGPRDMYCTALYGNALWAALRRRVQCRNRDVLTPADLAVSEIFDPVPMKWVKLPPKEQSMQG